jgi:hypothetical protein
VVKVKRIILSEQPKYKKFQLASAAGFTVKEICPSGKCIIVGADNILIMTLEI